ncbi:DNA topology modulation protein FlaR [Paenibacillus sp. PL91]|uniref:DNA topology modulation protein FlaR n=1 Tax=Paenibacillus sp. PL91 TaxID=2729538 RepID=UPI00145D14F9|nr:DNA topology modulation protein FlaR [Paenibacillus sp. PL91]MBC9199356.1 DNA topology modulation protein FlaR [Paenibacillus sp. PL91]
MASKMPHKIHIIGSVGSGKSTLAKQLSTKLSIPYYELDNVVWRRTDNGDVRNSTEVRDAQLHNIIASDQWITEGVHYKWTQQCFENAEMIIYLDTAIWIRNYRILKRFIIQKLGIEKGNYEQTFEMLRKMYIWNYNYEKRDRPVIFKILEPYQDKVRVMKDNNKKELHAAKIMTNVN